MTWLIVHGRQPLVTYVTSVIVAVTALGVGLLGVWWDGFVFVGFELSIGLTVLALVGGFIAVRRGGSLLLSVWIVFAPVAAITLATTNPSSSSTQPIEVIGTVLHVGLGPAVPGGLLVYTLGVRSRTGPWEDALRNHFPTRPKAVSPVIVASWVGVVSLLTAGLAVRLLNLGSTLSALLYGGAVVAGFAGLRGKDATESMVLGFVTGIGVGLSTSLGFMLATASPDYSIGMLLLGAIVVGIPIGAIGYLAGRAVRADSEIQRPASSQTDTVAT